MLSLKKVAKKPELKNFLGLVKIWVQKDLSIEKKLLVKKPGQILPGQLLHGQMSKTPWIIFSCQISALLIILCGWVLS